MTVRRLRPHASTIFSEVSELATRFDAINLGQGFPDTDGPSSMIEAAVKAMRDGHNQYPPGIGTPWGTSAFLVSSLSIAITEVARPEWV